MVRTHISCYFIWILNFHKYPFALRHYILAYMFTEKHQEMRIKKTQNIYFHLKHKNKPKTSKFSLLIATAAASSSIIINNNIGITVVAWKMVFAKFFIGIVSVMIMTQHSLYSRNHFQTDLFSENRKWENNLWSCEQNGKPATYLMLITRCVLLPTLDSVVKKREIWRWVCIYLWMCMYMCLCACVYAFTPNPESN